MDRKKNVRDIFEAVIREVSLTPQFNGDLDRSLYQFFVAYQLSRNLHENYQWLPMTQALYSLALYRSDGQRPVSPNSSTTPKSSAMTLQEFEALSRRETRSVESCQEAFSGLLFLLENRSSRFGATEAVLKQCLLGADPTGLGLMVKAFHIVLANSWKNPAWILKRPFEKFWESSEVSDAVIHGWRLAEASSLDVQNAPSPWKSSWAEELWDRACSQSAESAWEKAEEILRAGINFDQFANILQILRGRFLMTMKVEQWPIVTDSVFYGEALMELGYWMPNFKKAILAINISDFTRTAQLVGASVLKRPTGQSILDGASRNISKDRLILRLDDACERGERDHALELLAVILKDQGLSKSVGDRLLLIACKQDAYTFNQTTMATALSLVKAYEGCRRVGIHGDAVTDGIFGLLRFLSDERDLSKAVTKKTGTYGNGLSPSQYDVSGGARIVDRFVFNQMRNAQRIKIWPTDN